MSNNKLTVSKEIVKSRYVAEVCSGQKTAEMLAKELGISGSRLSRIVKGKAKPVANGGKPIYVSVAKDAKAKDIADGILKEALNDLGEAQAALRNEGKDGRMKALGLVNKLMRILEVALKEPAVQIDARTQTVNVIHDTTYDILCDACKKKVEDSALRQITAGQS